MKADNFTFNGDADDKEVIPVHWSIEFSLGGVITLALVQCNNVGDDMVGMDRDCW